MLFLQVFWGALAAGLDTGLIYNTFPLMNGSWLPANAFSIQPVIANLIENPGMVQWAHRVLGTVLALAVLGLWVKTIREDVPNKVKLLVHALGGIIMIQYLLGIFTLLYHVPVALGVTHQVLAMILWIVWLAFYQWVSTVTESIPV